MFRRRARNRASRGRRFFRKREQALAAPDYPAPRRPALQYAHSAARLRIWGAHANAAIPPS